MAYHRFTIPLAAASTRIPSVIIALRKAKGRHRRVQQKNVPPPERIFDRRYM